MLLSVSTTPVNVVQPDFLLGEEPLVGYRVGGYHPTNIGDVLNERYQICRKLGWGRYSTVWLVHDKRTDKYRSVKILTDRTSHTSVLHELEFLQHLAKFDPTHPGYSRIIHLFDHFYHGGPHGNHLCLVTEVLAESVHSFASFLESNTIHVSVAKSIIRQVLQGLDYLHKSGIVHTDLKLDNFLMEIDDMDAYVRRALASSSPEVYPEVQTANGTTIIYVGSTPLAVPSEDVENLRPLKVKIADFGVACWESKATGHFTDQIQPPALRAPEVWVGAGWDRKCDIWNLGLLVVEMLRGSPLIPIGMETDAGNVFFLTCHFGNFPVDLLQKGKYSAKYFKADGSFIHDFPEEAALIPKWSEAVKSLEKVLHPNEFSKLLSFLQATLSLRPEDRPTAAQLLEHEWLNSETRILET